jgi:hypothetical protein
MGKEVLAISLNHGVHGDSDLYRLKRGSILHLKPGISLLGQKVAIFGNYPAKGSYFGRYLLKPPI